MGLRKARDAIREPEDWTRTVISDDLEETLARIRAAHHRRKDSRWLTVPNDLTVDASVIEAYDRGRELVETGRMNEAIPHLRKAAEGGHLNAAFNLGVLLQKQDTVEAVRLWRVAAERGHADATANLAVLLYRIEPEVAAELFQYAAEGGNVMAMNNFAVHLYGRGELAEAKEWWRRAAEGGHPNAQAAYADILRQEGHRKLDPSPVNPGETDFFGNSWVPMAS